MTTLSGQSDRCSEYGTTEISGANNAANRVAWSHVLATATLNDGTPITTFNFTKGIDNWDPIPALVAADVKDLSTKVSETPAVSSVQLYGYENRIYVSNVKSNTQITLYSVDGAVYKSVKAIADISFTLPAGLWIAKASSIEGNKTVKIVVD